jgi:hypothetical protein
MPVIRQVSKQVDTVWVLVRVALLLTPSLVLRLRLAWGLLDGYCHVRPRVLRVVGCTTNGCRLVFDEIPGIALPIGLVPFSGADGARYLEVSRERSLKVLETDNYLGT